MMKTVGYNSLRSWLVLLAVTVILCLGSLPLRLTGLLFVIFREQYDTDREQATIPIVLFGVLRTVLGPITGLLGEKYGCQLIILIGCILSAVGIGACFFVKNITGLIISIGLISGVACALSINLLQTVLRQQFDKNFNLITGFFQAGSILGTIIVTPVVLYLNTEYGVSGMFLILSAIVLHCVPAAFLLKDPKYDEKKHKVVKNEEIKVENETTERVINEKSEELNDSKQKCYIVYENASFVNDELKINGKQSYFHHTPDVKLVCFTEKDYDNFDGNKTNSMIECKTSSIVTENSSLVWQLRQLFIDPTFYIIMFIVSFHQFICSVNWTVMVDYALDKGFSHSQAELVVMFLLVSEVVGCISLNWIVDKEFMTRANFTTICFLLMAISAECINWTYSYSFTVAYVTCLSFLSGVSRSSFPGMIFDYIDKDKQSLALASRNLPYALLCFTITPIVGYFRDTLGSYVYVYYLISASCVFSAMISFLSPMAASFRERRNKLKTETQN